MSAGVVYRFERGELDGARHRLQVDGHPVELEPKAFAVLEDLLAHAGTMRSRDELLDAVWGHRHVTPAVLNRCIGQVRKALGDHAESPRFVQTVHTLGYRFIAPVETVAAVGEAASATVAVPPMVTPPTTVATPTRWRAWGIAAGVVALALIGGLAWRSRDGASAPGELVARAPTQVVLVPFDVPKDANELEPPVRALETGVLQRLRMLPGLRVERGRADAPGVVLTGAVVGTPDDRKLRVRVLNADAPFDRTYSLKLKTLLDTTIGIQGDVVRLLRPDSADILEPSGVLDAGQFVRSGMRARTGLKRSDQADAIAAFEQALRLDPTNADAWCFLGGLYLAPANESMGSKDVAVPRASEAIARGLRLDPASAHCLAKQGNLLLAQGRIDEAEVSFRRAVALEPALYPPRESIANIEGSREHFARYRDELERIVREHPERGWTQFRLIDAYVMTGEPEKGRALEPVAEARFPELVNVNWPSAVLEANYGHPADAMRRYRALNTFDPDDRSYLLNIAWTAASIGEPKEAKQALAKAGFLDTPQFLLAHTWMFYALGDYGGAATWLRDAKVSPSLNLVRTALLAQSLALAGNREGALREYAHVYEEGWRDEDPAMRDGAYHLSAQMLNYAALLPPGAQRKEIVDAAERHLAKLRADGLGIPWCDYQAAQIAAMRGDRAAAMAALDVAIERGYTDVLSLSRDLPWRVLAGDPEFAQRKARLEKIAAEQRRIVAGDAKASTTVVTR
jgi:DNA-binding winged helix-turn-helix (wHTH) protein/tetratricopeptide (TPR) repeat protein